MKDARIYVDFNEMLEDDLVILSDNDFVEDSKGNIIKLKPGLKVKLYSNDFSACNEVDNLIADGVVELNSNRISGTKWNCRINRSGVYNESQKRQNS